VTSQTLDNMNSTSIYQTRNSNSIQPSDTWGRERKRRGREREREGGERGGERGYREKGKIKKIQIE
jgi:hypothetical protein